MIKRNGGLILLGLLTIAVATLLHGIPKPTRSSLEGSGVLTSKKRKRGIDCHVYRLTFSGDLERIADQTLPATRVSTKIFHHVRLNDGILTHVSDVVRSDYVSGHVNLVQGEAFANLPVEQQAIVSLQNLHIFQSPASASISENQQPAQPATAQHSESPSCSVAPDGEDPVDESFGKMAVE